MARAQLAWPESRPAADERHAPRSRSAARTAVRIVDLLVGPLGPRDFAVRLWDGTTLEPQAGQEARFTLVVQRPSALRTTALPPSQLALGEAFVRGDYTIEGDIVAATALGERLLAAPRRAGDWYRLARLLLTLPAGESARPAGRAEAERRGRRHSRRRDRATVTAHYDVGNDFYALWLDHRMVYSCAYFTTDTESLDAAQEAKLELICRKLRLAAGQRLLDIGCGWGGLILYAAQHHGVQAVGITLSEPQAAQARRRIAAAGLQGRCRVEVCDYRDADALGTFDRVASIGMAEHVGLARLPAYFATVRRALRPGGLFLNHAIAQAAAPDSAGWTARAIGSLEALRGRGGPFIDRHVFPDGELVPIGRTLSLAEAAGFEVRDVESLREHYALTLCHWVRRLESHEQEALALVGEETYRIWRLYMAGCAYAFSSGGISVYQSLLSRTGAEGRAELPLTRAHLIAPAGA